MYHVPSKGFETTSRTFLSKHLNIIDPLKESNNLGRSVSKGDDNNYLLLRRGMGFLVSHICSSS